MLLSLSLDLGTTSIAGIAVTPDGAIVGSVQQANATSREGLPVGHAEQDPLAIREIALDVLSELATDLPGTPACLGLTGQMHGVLLTDARRIPLTSLITWQDRRANEPATNGPGSWLEIYRTACNENDLSRTGCQLSPGFLASTVSVLSQTDRIPPKATRAAFLADWLAAELTDSEIVTDRSNAAASGVYDLVNDCWSDSLLSAGRLPARLFPAVVDSGHVLGPLSSDVACRTGLPTGLPVCGAIGDNQAAVLGSLPANESAIQINVGTGGQISWPVDQFLSVTGMDTRYLPHHRFLLVGAGLAGGDAYAWINHVLGQWLSPFGDLPSRDFLYRRLNALAAEVPSDAHGLTCQPVFRGTRREPHARGQLSGITWDNFTPGHLARAVLAGIADGFAWFFENAGTAQPAHFNKIIGSGNGLRQNPLLIDGLAHRFDRPVYLPAHSQESAFGAALLAGSECGIWSDLAAAGNCIELVRQDTSTRCD